VLSSLRAVLEEGSIARYPRLVFTSLAGATRRIGLLVHQRDAEGALVALLKDALAR
jgi:hypothetical protein